MTSKLNYKHHKLWKKDEIRNNHDKFRKANEVILTYELGKRYEIRICNKLT